MKLNTFKRTVSLLAVITMFFVIARADVVTDWNARTVGHASTPGVRPGPTWVQDVAVVQLAVYDAVQALEGDYQPYCGSIPGASGSVVAAVSKAARDVLVNRFPARMALIDAEYALATMGIDPNDPGFDVGEAAAACMIALRTGDGAFPNPPVPPFFGGVLIGEWRPTASGPLVFPWLGSMMPYTLKSNDQFRAGPPPDLKSPEYTRAYREVKALGGSVATGHSRTAEQTELANFWNGSFPGQMNKLARDLSVEHALSVSESSRLLALVDVSMADAMITAWSDKVYYNFWRPETAIRLGESDGNEKTDGDMTWSPLVATPPYPDHTSGANSLAASATRALSLFFDTNEMEFEIMTTNPGPTENDIRSYTKFSEVRDEVVEARILQGIHFRFADADARKQSEHIAQWVYSHFFRAVE